jgi:tetratricopeptide (TPR) repeat protein
MAPGSRLQELTAKYMQNPRRFFVPLANEYRLGGDVDRAIALCREHLPGQPGYMSGHIVLGRAYFEKGDLDAARDVFLTSVALDDENLIALSHLGDIARLREAVVEARGWYARVLDVDPDNREIEQLLRSLDSGAAAAPVTRSPAPGAATASVSSVPMGSGPHDAPAALASAPVDHTPPGLKAILGDLVEPPLDARVARTAEATPTAESRPLLPLDRSAVDAFIDHEELSATASTPELMSAAQANIAVEGGVGFMIGDLDELVDPTALGAVPDILPPSRGEDLTIGVETLAASPAQPPADDILSRPVFSALASFASWRTARERETPPSVPPVDAERPLDGIVASAADPRDAWDESPPADSAGTAPEFMTETMAALYAQQGFPQQALDIYRALLARKPGDASLTMKVVDLEVTPSASAADAALEDDAETALHFGDLSDLASSSRGSDSARDHAVGGVPSSSVDPLQDAFGGAWSPSSEAPGAGDDWFSDLAGATGAEADEGVDLFGLSIGELDVGGGSAFARSSAPEGGRQGMDLIALFGAAIVASSDQSAAAILESLAGQMVGRLPKEPPTLPVPDVLEMPAAVAADKRTGASAAPLLSFDRFFSGSGSRPRQRLDTPVRPGPLAAPRDTGSMPVVAAPSLSPTFGGLPVIPPSPVAPTPSWTGFDQFISPAAPGTPVPPAALPPAAPTGAFWTPDAVPAIPALPGAPMDDVTTLPPVVPSAPEPTPRAEPVAEEARRPPPSDFHRWLEGLS